MTWNIGMATSIQDVCQPGMVQSCQAVTMVVMPWPRQTMYMLWPEWENVGYCQHHASVMANI